MNIALKTNLYFTLPMMQGLRVEALQEALVRRGILGFDDVDGFFGQDTKKAVEHFQRQQGLTVDGIVGQGTRDALGGFFDAPTEQELADAIAARQVGEQPAQEPQQAPHAPTASLHARHVPASWMPDARMRRIILHWTAGAHSPNSVDKKHYHILIGGDGQVYRGVHPISANVPPLKGKPYAAHTLNCNSNSIGVSLCAMGGDSRERPFRPGPFPITSLQWNRLAQVVAELCERYEIEVTRETVLGHGEVQRNLGIKQSGKWDPLALPWAPGRPYREVGDEMREMVTKALDALNRPVSAIEFEPETPPSETITLNGAALDAVSMDGRIWVSLQRLATLQSWVNVTLDPNEDVASVLVNDQTLRFAILRTKGEDGKELHWVEVNEVGEKLDLKQTVNAEGNIDLIYVRQEPGREQVIVKRGQTAFQIARLHLGDASRWTELSTEDGTALNETLARKLQIGQVLLLPDGETLAKPGSNKFSPGKPLSNAKITAIASRISLKDGGSKPAQSKKHKAVEQILQACVKFKVHDLSHQAYILATAYHESSLGLRMKEIWGPTDRQRGYEGRNDLGNTQPGDGERFMGRGFVQITGRHNYQKYADILQRPLVGDPDLVMEPELAAIILVRGMCEFGFTGVLLPSYGLDGDFDWFNARSVINGDKNCGGDDRYPGRTKGQGIADKARAYREEIASA